MVSVRIKAWALREPEALIRSYLEGRSWEKVTRRQIREAAAYYGFDAESEGAASFFLEELKMTIAIARGRTREMALENAGRYLRQLEGQFDARRLETIADAICARLEAAGAEGRWILVD